MHDTRHWILVKDCYEYDIANTVDYTQQFRAKLASNDSRLVICLAHCLQ